MWTRLLGLLLLVMTACTVQAADDLRFGVTVGAVGNQVTLTAENGAAYFDIYSERGIGQATVQWLVGPYPERIILRLHLHGLEELRLAYGTMVMTLGISSMGDNAVWQNAIDLRTAASQTERLTSASPYWMKITVNSENGVTSPTIPLNDGWIELELPPDFVQTGHTLFSIHWVDFFRR